jgi:hypothetical protein
MKRLIAGAAGVTAALLVGCVGGLGGGVGPHVATSDPTFPWLPPAPSPVGAATTAEVV